jgi:mitochondrial enoyl-[acyl-carrier protein] reductase / trans-2-enoyl-CoA reductase
MTARVVCIHEFGDPASVVRVETRELPRPGPGEVLIDMLAAPINPADLNILEGRYGTLPELPAVCGNEGAGIVRECGPGVAHLAPGRWVRPPAGTGCWREALVAMAEDCLPLPDGLEAEQAAMISVNPPTAWRMIEDFVDLKPGDWIVQNAANSGVGRCVIRIARHRGLRTLNVVRRPELRDELKALGADAVVLEDEPYYKNIAGITGGPKPRLALNAVGGESANRLLRCLARGATMVTYGGMSKQPVNAGAAQFIFSDLRLRGFWISRWMKEAPREAVLNLFSQIAPLIRDGTLHVPVDATFPIDAAADAIRRAAQPGRNGKVLFKFR